MVRQSLSLLLITLTAVACNSDTFANPKGQYTLWYERSEKSRVAAEAEKAEENAQGSMRQMYNQFVVSTRPKTTIDLNIVQSNKQLSQGNLAPPGHVRLPAPGPDQDFRFWQPKLKVYDPKIEVDESVLHCFIDETLEAAEKKDYAFLPQAMRHTLKAAGVFLDSEKREVNNIGLLMLKQLRDQKIADEQGFLTLPGVEFDSSYFKTSLDDMNGRELRNSMNWVLMGDYLVNSGGDVDPKFAEAVEKYREWSEEVKVAHLLADHFYATGNTQPYKILEAELERGAEFTKGFVQGVASGTVGLVKAIPQLVIHAPELTVALGRAIINYEATWKHTKQFVSDRYEHLKNADAREWGEFTGELTVTVLTLAVPPASAVRWFKNGAQALKGVEYAAAVAMVEVRTSAVGKGASASIELAEVALEATPSTLAWNKRAAVGAEIVDSAGRNAANWGHWGDLERITVSGREYAAVNNRLFTQHAVEHMAPRGLGSAAGANPVLGRGVPPGVVEDVITNGQLVNEVVAASGAARQTWLRDGVQVITEQAGRIVVTVMRVGTQ